MLNLDKLGKLELSRKEFLQLGAVLIASLFGVYGVWRELRSRAGTPTAAFQPESGTVTGNAKVVDDSSASKSQAIQFTKPGTSPKSGMLVGGRCRYPGTSTVKQDFATGESDFGTLQVTKDYFGGTAAKPGVLPTTYSKPFPSRVTVVLSMDKYTVTDDANFKAFVQSLDAGKTILTYQHEPERPGYFKNGADYVSKFNQYRDRVRAVRTDIPVWFVSSGYQYRNNGTKPGPGYDGSYFSGTDADGKSYKIAADGYGYDGYRNGSNTGVQGQALTLIQNRDEFLRWKSFVPTGKPWGVTEMGNGDNNQSGWTLQQRINCTRDSATWLKNNGASMLIYFFSGEGPDGGDWLPTDQGFKDMYKLLTRA